MVFFFGGGGGGGGGGGEGTLVTSTSYKWQVMIGK